MGFNSAFKGLMKFGMEINGFVEPNLLHETL